MSLWTKTMRFCWCLKSSFDIKQQHTHTQFTMKSRIEICFTYSCVYQIPLIAELFGSSKIFMKTKTEKSERTNERQFVFSMPLSFALNLCNNGSFVRSFVWSIWMSADGFLLFSAIHLRLCAPFMWELTFNIFVACFFFVHSRHGNHTFTGSLIADSYK